VWVEGLQVADADAQSRQKFPEVPQVVLLALLGGATQPSEVQHPAQF
jgi:hypothetical protein